VDSVAVAALTSLLLLVWAMTVLVVFLAACGVSSSDDSVPWWLVALAVLVAVATAVPLSRWLRPAIESMLFSQPEDGRALIAQVGQRFGTDGAGGRSDAALLDEIGHQIAARLRLPYVAITPAGSEGHEPGETVRSGGTGAAGRLTRIPLMFAAEEVGTLLVLPRARERGLSGPDRALLDELAVHVAIALRATHVSAEVQRSRAALVTAREEERRRIRRDLHDGLGPSLASLRLQLAAVQQLLPDQPDQARELIDRLRSDLKGTAAQVRELVYGLRPGSLDELGLVPSLRARAGELSAVDVRIEAPDPVPELSAAAEVALYRIGCEALANVARHAAAATCVLSLAVTPSHVLLEVRDDGRGLPDPLVPGVGLAGIRERAEELAGTMTLSTDQGITRLTVCLPRPAVPAAGAAGPGR
jgi:two-component system NarL family sensor kinase